MIDLGVNINVDATELILIKHKLSDLYESLLTNHKLLKINMFLVDFSDKIRETLNLALKYPDGSTFIQIKNILSNLS